MADINTILRETSVIVGINDIHENLNHSLSKSSYEKKAKAILFNQYNKIQEKLAGIIDFSSEQMDILGNGYLLAKIISEKLNIKKVESSSWVADESPDRPFDITINGLNFSLKEDSNVLTNMGLYKLVNIITSSNFSTISIYKDFANEQYNEWFKYTFEAFVSFLKKNLNTYEYIGAKVKSLTKLLGEKVYFGIYSVDKLIFSSTLDINNLTTDTYTKYTNSKIREYTFSKWINQYFSTDSNYVNLKSKASLAAGNNLVSYLKKNYNPADNFMSLFRIYEKEYFYAKVVNGKVDLYRVPSKSEIESKLRLVLISSSVPKSQINIISEFKNTINNGVVKLRNECRFSHGQFASVPEAKLYFDRKFGPINLYEKIY
jgi:hypothetical protein